MIDKKTASRLYAMNQMGMDRPKRPKKKKDQEVSMNCSKDGCAAYDSGGGVSNVGNNDYKSGKTAPASKGAKNVVLQKGSRKEARWQRKLAKVRGASDRSKF
jgi:hypothetical protein